MEQGNKKKIKQTKKKKNINDNNRDVDDSNSDDEYDDDEEEEEEIITINKTEYERLFKFRTEFSNIIHTIRKTNKDEYENHKSKKRKHISIEDYERAENGFKMKKGVKWDKDWDVFLSDDFKGKFHLILADPPWSYKDGSTTVNAATDHYDTMQNNQLYSMPVNKLAADNCMILVWTTSAHLRTAINCIESWGFEYKNMMFNWIKVWPTNNKPVCGPGWYTRPASEFVLMGIKGNMLQYKEDAGVSQIIVHPRVGGQKKHSRKPMDALCDKLKLFFGDNYKKMKKIELFSRTSYPGWHCWGKETKKFDQQDKLSNINKKKKEQKNKKIKKSKQESSPSSSPTIDNENKV